MCGINFSLSRDENYMLNTRGLEALKCRGPDVLLRRTLIFKAQPFPLYLTFYASVLALRGSEVHPQPLIDPQSGSILCWNGEAWRIKGEPVQGNDSKAVFRLLVDAVYNDDDENTSPPNSRERICDVLANIAGPWAFVFYDAKNASIYFGRDNLGRRSLLVSNGSVADEGLVIASTSVGESMRSFDEVSTDGIYCLQLQKQHSIVQKLDRLNSSPIINRNLSNTTVDLHDCPSDPVIDELIVYLSRSLEARVKDVPTYTANTNTGKPSRVAVLFSGGLDCTLLARITHDILDPDQPVDLLNVAFENPRVAKAASSSKAFDNQQDSTTIYESCPDRMTGRSSFQELQAICPQREWRFVAINVPYHEMLDHRSTIIQLMRPHNTEMDLSITMALYFAARGQGELQIEPAPAPTSKGYTTTARVLLSGLGADEIFGGYSRHAAAFARGGYCSLINELDLDFSRIGSRNLGRDDRVISHFGREIRYAFLDEDFVDFALALPVWEKTGFRSEKRILKHFEEHDQSLVEKPEDLDAAKMLLRCAAWKLGMKRVANEKKRAIQFGARTAKMHAGKTKGTDIVTEKDAIRDPERITS